MADNDLDKLLDRWDKLAGSIDKLLVSKPQQVTEASASLEADRAAMAEAIGELIRTRAPARKEID